MWCGRVGAMSDRCRATSARIPARTADTLFSIKMFLKLNGDHPLIGDFVTKRKTRKKKVLQALQPLQDPQVTRAGPTHSHQTSSTSAFRRAPARARCSSRPQLSISSPETCLGSCSAPAGRARPGLLPRTPSTPFANAEQGQTVRSALERRPSR